MVFSLQYLPGLWLFAVSDWLLRRFIIQALNLLKALLVCYPCYTLPHTEKERTEQCQSGLGTLDRGTLKQMGYEHRVLIFLLRFIYLSLPLVPISIYFHEVIILASN